MSRFKSRCSDLADEPFSERSSGIHAKQVFLVRGETDQVIQHRSEAGILLLVM